MQPQFRHAGVVEAIVIVAAASLVTAFGAFNAWGARTAVTAVPAPVQPHAAPEARTSDATDAAALSLPDVEWEARQHAMRAATRLAAGSAASAAPAAGEVIPLPLPEEFHVAVRAVDAAPAMSSAAVRRWLAAQGIAFAATDEWNGAPVTVTAAYGLTTVGTTAEDGMWLGPRNLALPTGEVLDHIEDRLTWVLVYEHAPLSVPVGDQTVTPAHTLYVIDAETLTIMVAMMFSTAS
jgi:hypothetical protein